MSGKSAHIQRLPALAVSSARSWGLGALALLLTAGCGKERSPWYGFDLFPAESAPADGADSESADTANGMPNPQGGGTAGAGPRATGDNQATSGGELGAVGPRSAAGSGAVGVTPVQTPEGSVPSMTSTGTGAPDSAQQPRDMDAAVATPFRITELQLRDPHIFAGTQDLTEQEVLGQSVNRTLIPEKLTKDGDGDGALDVSVIALLSPFAPDAAPGQMPELRLVDASCPVNSSPSAPCKPLDGSSGLQATWQVTQHPDGSCMGPEPGTTSNYQPAVSVPSAPCFDSTSGQDLTMDVGGIKIKVTAARVSATYQASPPALVQGLLAGFVTRTAAMEATLPSAAGPTVAGDSLSTYIRQRDYDQSASPNGEDGFWMYMNFVAKPIDYEP